MRVAGFLFWLSAIWIAYVWIGYPLMLRALSSIRRFRSRTEDSFCPVVSVLIAARNEQKDIGWKIAQTLAWDYPADKLEILVGSDASTDGTDDVIRSLRNSRLVFARNRERAGKCTTLNRLAQLARGELLFFTDANTSIAPYCLKTMVRHFADSRVGCVTGMECNVTNPEASSIATGNNTYLEYESAIDALESNLGSVLVCDGSMYCLRRNLFTKLDPDLANDLEHPIRVGAAGAAILYEPQARSVEHCSSSSQEEFARRRRIAAQGALAMWRLRRQLQGLRLWQFVSRKFLRWLTVIPLALALATSFLLRREPVYAALLAMQATFYAAALLGLWQGATFQIKGLARLPYIFLLANVAVFVGVLDACRRKKFATWNIAGLSRGLETQAGS